jgi:hypothetical protein
MATRQMNYLRKHQKPILVVLGVILMVMFTAGYAIDTLINNAASGPSNGRTADPVAVTWVGGKVRESELDMKRTTHQVAVNFLRYLIATVIDRGGKPIVSGVTVTKDMPLNQVNLGIGDDSNEMLIVRMMLLARKADELGIAVDLQAAREYVESIAIPDVPPEEWQALLKKVTPQGLSMSVDQVLAQIALDLKASRAAQLLQAGLAGIPPGQMWDYHNRLNRRFVIEAYPVEVAPFGAQVQGEPTDPELRAIFEKGKLEDPNPSLAEPGFHIPQKIAFQWLRIDRGPFVEAAMKKITDEQVAKQYELDKTQGKHKVIELPADPTKSADPAAPGNPAAPADASKPADSDKPADPAKPGDEKPAEDKPADKPGEEKPAADKPAAEKPADKPAEPGAQEKPCTQEQPATETQPDDKKPAEKAADKPDDAKLTEKPAETKPDETPATPPTTTPPTTTQPATPGTATPAVTPAPPPKFKPLEEVKEDIRRELAQPIAEDEIKAALKKATDEINNYGRKYRRWKSAQDAIKEGLKAGKVEDPGQLDLEGIAARYGFKSGSTKLVDRYEIGEFEIGQKVSEIDFEAFRVTRQFQQLSFADMVYGVSDVLYAPNPDPVNSTDPDVSFIYWRTDEQEPKDAKFEEVRASLVEAWKFAKALELAKAEAQKQADKAKSTMSLKDAVADPTKVITTVPFSWLTSGSLAFGSGMPSLSTVPGIDLAGTEFMAAVFSLRPGETGTAPNQSHRTVYVVRVVSQEPSDDVLKEQFLESGQSMPVQMVAYLDRQRTSGEMFDGLEKEMGLVWERPPIVTASR